VLILKLKTEEGITFGGHIPDEGRRVSV